MANGFKHLKTTCCNARCSGNYLPDAWRIDLGDGAVYGPFGAAEWQGVHKVEFVQGPLADFPHACHWSKVIGFAQDLHVYKYFGDTDQLSIVWDVLLQNGGDEILFTRTVVGQHDCLNGNAPFGSTTPPGEDWTSIAALDFRPWRYNDEP